MQLIFLSYEAPFGRNCKKKNGPRLVAFKFFEQGLKNINFPFLLCPVPLMLSLLLQMNVCQVPKWATGAQLRTALLKQAYMPPKLGTRFNGR